MLQATYFDISILNATRLNVLDFLITIFAFWYRTIQIPNSSQRKFGTFKSNYVSL